MVAKGRNSSNGSPKVEVGEIDTSAPFQSVKDAVTLFGESAFSGEKPLVRKASPLSAEKVSVKEPQLHMAQKELIKLKNQLKNAETTKEQAIIELENARRTVDDLTKKLKSVNESRDTAIKSKEAATNQVKQFEEAKPENVSVSNDTQRQDIETTVEQYMAVFHELDAAKKELRKIHRDRYEVSEAKVAALNEAEEAKHSAEANSERIKELSMELSTTKASIEDAKVLCSQARDQQAEIFSDKDNQRRLYIAKMEESQKKLLALKTDIDPQNLESELAEKMNEINVLQKQMENSKASDMDSVRSVTAELDDAKGSLLRFVEEESSLRNTVESLKQELENVKKEHAALKAKEAETESVASNLQFNLQKSKSELESCLAEESKTRAVYEDMITTMNQLASETETARSESEEMRIKAEEVRKEAEAARIALEEAEENLRVALEEAEEAKAAENRALEQIKALSEKTNAARTSTSESGAQITISREEFESLGRKVEESDKLAGLKVAAALAQVEAVKASENEALKRLEAAQKEIEDIKVATKEAVKKAEMAEAARKAVEGELRRWREREQKKAAEAASRILAATETAAVESSPKHYKIQKQKSVEKVVETTRKLEKAKTSVVTKKVLIPSISGIFNRKRNEFDGESLSYLPGEKPF